MKGYSCCGVCEWEICKREVCKWEVCNREGGIVERKWEGVLKKFGRSRAYLAYIQDASNGCTKGVLIVYLGCM